MVYSGSDEEDLSADEEYTSDCSDNDSDFDGGSSSKRKATDKSKTSSSLKKTVAKKSTPKISSKKSKKFGKPVLISFVELHRVISHFLEVGGWDLLRYFHYLNYLNFFHTHFHPKQQQQNHMTAYMHETVTLSCNC